MVEYDSARRLLIWLEGLRAAGHVSPIAPPAETEPLAVGQIRRISASPGQNYWSALGLVGHIDRKSSRAMMVLVKSSEFATVRDVLLAGPSSTAPVAVTTSGVLSGKKVLQISSGSDHTIARIG